MKGERLLKIQEIVEHRAVETQEELAEALREAGFPVTQATVSRDIKRMQLVKIALPDGRYRYALPTRPSTLDPEGKLSRMLNEVFVAIDSAENLVVMRTIPGHAHAVAFLFDSIDFSEVIGTVAGDDTILFVSRSREDADHFIGRVKALFR
jgi:transcriptional regulator of arginine metabolism